MIFRLPCNKDGFGIYGFMLWAMNCRSDDNKAQRTVEMTFMNVGSCFTTMQMFLLCLTVIVQATCKGREKHQ